MNKFAKLSAYIWGVALVIIAILYIIQVNMSSAQTHAYVNQSNAIKSQISKVHSLTDTAQSEVAYRLSELSDMRSLSADLNGYHTYLTGKVIQLKRKLKDVLIEIKQYSKPTKAAV